MTEKLQTSILRGALLLAAILLFTANTTLGGRVLVNDGGSALPQRLAPDSITSSEWTLVPGLGPQIAQRLDDARRHGRFHGLEGGALLEEIARVRGVGKMTLRRARPFLSTAARPGTER